ncbi:MAG: efflux RND transporter periplasmic adaptor subunit [Acidobacteria bacterium]|nr:efflux RND transporter periplasmic adaptor subunit [Acidobacteriota bacterium]
MAAPTQDPQSGAPSIDPTHELPAHATPDAPAEKKRGPWRLIMVGLLVALAVAFVVWRISTNKPEKKLSGRTSLGDRPVPVAVEKASYTQVPIYLTALGTVTAYNTVTLKSRVDGQIIAVNFREGQHVRPGQSLIKIDPRPYQAALDQARGNLARDEANARLASTQANRYSALYQAGVVSREQEQTQQSTAGQASGTLEADRAAIKAAQVNLAYTNITSPISGIVGLRQVDIGNIVSANSSNGLVVITQVQPISVIFTLPEDQLPQVFSHMKRGGKLAVEAWDRTNTQKIATGALLTVDNQIDPATGTAKLKAVFDNKDEALYPNQFVNVRLILETRNHALTIPATALQTSNAGASFVYVVDMSKPAPETPPSGGGQGNGSQNRSTAGRSTDKGNAGSGKGGGHRQVSYLAHAKPVTVDLTQGSTVILAAGLTPGEVVVVDGQEKLKDGSKVTLRGSTGGPAGISQSGDAAGRKYAGGPEGGATPQSPGGTPKSQEQHSNGAERPHRNGNGAARP